MSVQAFLSSLGIITHIDQGVSGGSYVQPLRYLGVRNIRDGVRNTPQVQMLNRVLGVRLDLFLEGGDLQASLDIARKMAASGTLLAVEGPNEPNNFPITYNGEVGGGMGSWLPVARFQRDLYRAVKQDAVLAKYPVLAVTESGAEVDNVGLQYLTIPQGAGSTMADSTRFADYANAHNYVSSNGKKYINNQAWHAADPILNGPWDGLYGNYGVTWRNHFRGYATEDLPTLPRVTTETGYDTVSDSGGERIQGVVLVNTYLAQFKRGWSYTFIYQLRDGEGGNDHFGIYNSNSTPKLAATYIHNLTSVLADAGAPIATGSLDYSIKDMPSTVHDLLLEKSDGTFELIVWDENTSGSDDVTITLDRTYNTINIYDITAGASPIKTHTQADRVLLHLNDHAQIIEIQNR